MHLGGQPLFGYYYGANDKKRLSELLRFCIRFISAVAAVLTAAIFLAAPLLMRCFMNNKSIISDGTVMRWQVITMIFVGIILLMTIIFQSMGKVVGSFVLSISRQGIFFGRPCNRLQYNRIYGDYHITGRSGFTDIDYCRRII